MAKINLFVKMRHQFVKERDLQNKLFVYALDELDPKNRKRGWTLYRSFCHLFSSIDATTNFISDISIKVRKCKLIELCKSCSHKSEILFFICYIPGFHSNFSIKLNEYFVVELFFISLNYVLSLDVYKYIFCTILAISPYPYFPMEAMTSNLF